MQYGYKYTQTFFKAEYSRLIKSFGNEIKPYLLSKIKAIVSSAGSACI